MRRRAPLPSFLTRLTDEDKAILAAVLAAEERQQQERVETRPKSLLDLDLLYGPPSPRYNPQPRHLQVEAELRRGRRHNLLVGGARSGKTFIFVKRVIERALLAPRSDHLIARFKGNAAHTSIWLGTIPIVLRMCFPNLRLVPHAADGYFECPNGSRIWVAGLDEKERIEKILGNEFVTIYPNEGSQIPYSSILVLRTRLAQVVVTESGDQLPQQEFADLNPVGKSHWSYREWLLGINAENRRPIPNHERDYYHAFLQPQDNEANLDPAYLESLASAPDRHRKRFYEGQYVEEVEGALWTAEALDHARVAPDELPETLERVVVAIDPSGTDGDEDKRSDDVGIVVAGRQGSGSKSVAYLIDDLTCNEPPMEWGRRAVAAYRKHRADRIVAEANFGGEMVRAVIVAAAQTMGVPQPPVELVKASRGKAVRAEPVSVLAGHIVSDEWVGDRVRHAGEFTLLEEELLAFSTYGYTGARSPNRADAYVWAMSDLMIEGNKYPALWTEDDVRVVA